MQIFSSISNFFRIILYLCGPAIPLLLPDLIFNLDYECNAEEEKKKQLQNNQVPPNQQNENGQRQVELSTNTEYSFIEGHSYIGRDRYVQTDYHEGLQLIIVNNQIVPDQQNEMDQSGETTYEEDSYQEGDKRQNEGTVNCDIPLDDASPITIRALLSDFMEELPAFKVNFNLKLLFMCFIVLPFLLYLQFALILCYNVELYREYYRKNSNFPYCKLQADIPEVIVCKIAGLSLEQLLTRYNILIFTTYGTSFVILLCVGPTAFLYPKEVRQFCYVKNCTAVSLGDEIVKHLKQLHRITYNVVFYALWNYVNTLKKCLVKCVVPCQINSVRFRLLRSLWHLFICSIVGLFVGVVLGVICVFCLLMALGLSFIVLSPAAALLIFQMKKNFQLNCHIKRACSKCNTWLLFLSIFCLFSITSIQTFILVTSLLGTSVFVIVQLFLLTVMGLVVNVELVTPYVAFILVVTKNLHLCYCNLQSRYKEVKGMISEQWKKSTERLPWVDNSNDETIPEDLFWFVCGKGQLYGHQNVIPLRVELCRMLRNMAIIVVFLFLSLFAILIFKSVNNISALVSTIFVFVSGAIPSLIFEGFTKREKFSGWRKINMKKKIKEAVKEYLRTMKEDDDDGGYVIRNG